MRYFFNKEFFHQEEGLGDWSCHETFTAGTGMWTRRKPSWFLVFSILKKLPNAGKEA
jgi:hypothetical protein